MDGQVSLFVFYRISVFVSHVFYGFGDLLHQKSYYCAGHKATIHGNAKISSRKI